MSEGKSQEVTQYCMSGVESQGVRRYVGREVAEIHTVPQEQSCRESRGTTGSAVARSHMGAESHAVIWERSCG